MKFMLRKSSILAVILLLAIVVSQVAAVEDENAGLVGFHQYIAGELDLENDTITLPLYEGSMTDGTPVWYILLDVSDEMAAADLGVNFSPDLALTEGGVRTATAGDGGKWVFEAGVVDFAPEHAVTPGEAPNFFPPAVVQPGSVADADYSPLVKVGDIVFNAPVIAYGVDAMGLNFCDGMVDKAVAHDKVVRLCPDEQTVTIALTHGFAFGREVVYISTDANVDVAAALEGSTLTPSLSNVSAEALTDIFVAVNGPMGVDNPYRQGLNSALSGEGSPFNVVGSVPDLSTGYTPIWAANIYVWSQAAIDAGYVTQISDSARQLFSLAEGGWITSPTGGEIGDSGPIINCPVVARLQ